MTAEDQLLRLRERVSRLRSLSLLGGASLSGDLKRLQKQIEQLEAAPTLADTPGAWRGVAAEQHGQGGMLARSHALMARLTVPIVSCIIGEGGSGGASAIALADRVLMQENAIYSVITPEGCAAILWRNADQAQKAAAAFKPDAAHCLELGVIDAIVPEPLGGAQNDYDEAAQLLAESIEQELSEIEDEPGTALRRQRRAKFRALGVFAPVL